MRLRVLDAGSDGAAGGAAVREHALRHQRVGTGCCQGWIERNAAIYRLKDARLEHYDPTLERQRPEFGALQRKLQAAVVRLCADAEAELAGVSNKARSARALRLPVNHREGLSAIVDTVNTTAQIRQACREFGRAFLVSVEALALIEPPSGAESERMPLATLKGKSRQFRLYAIDRTAPTERDERPQRAQVPGTVFGQ